MSQLQGSLDNFPSMARNPTQTLTCGTSVYPVQNGIMRNVFSRILLFSLYNPSWDLHQVIWSLFHSLFLVAEKYPLVQPSGNVS